MLGRVAVFFAVAFLTLVGCLVAADLVAVEGASAVSGAPPAAAERADALATEAHASEHHDVLRGLNPAQELAALSERSLEPWERPRRRAPSGPGPRLTAPAAWAATLPAPFAQLGQVSLSTLALDVHVDHRVEPCPSIRDAGDRRTAIRRVRRAAHVPRMGDDPPAA